MSVYLLATLDTKGREAAFVRDLLAGMGVTCVLVDCGALGQPAVVPDVPRHEVFAAAGAQLASVQQSGDRGQAVTLAAQGAARLVAERHAKGLVSGVMSLGGSAGTTIGTAAMRALPLGVPKLMISTLASGQVRPYVGDSDLLMLNPVVDLEGINRISRPVLINAARAMAGMVSLAQGLPPTADKPLLAATMFGVTTPCVSRARTLLEQAGYEVLVFHATGNGGRMMESLIEGGYLAGVLDITTTELADELVGGVLSAGAERLTAAARRGVPQVVSVGALDMVNFQAPETVPERFRQRKFHQHNPTVTLMRTTPEENALLGEEIGRKVAASRGSAAVLLPRKGISAIDREGQPFDDPQARQRLFEAIRLHAGKVEVIEMDCHINDAEFADKAAEKLLELVHAAQST